MRGAIPFICALLSLVLPALGCRPSAAGRRPAERPVILAENPTPRRWQLAGPFYPPKDCSAAEALDRDYLAPFGGEKAISLGESTEGDWKPATARGDVVDAGRVLGGNGARFAYALATVRCAEDSTAVLMYAGTGPKRAWVNGHLVYRPPVKKEYPFDKQDGIFAARLRKGQNRILLKLGSGPRGLKLSLTLANPFQWWIYRGGQYGRGMLRLSFKPGGAGASGSLKVAPPRWGSKRPAGKGLVTVRDLRGSVLRSFEADLRQPLELGFPREGIYAVEVFARYSDGFGRCGVRYVAAGDLAARIKGVRKRVLTWLGGPERKEVRHRGQVLWLAEAALGRDWRRTPGIKNLYWFVALEGLLARLEKGEDVLASRRGTFQWAFVSGADGSGQPLSISLPPEYEPRRTYPLVVFLHGSGGTFGTEAVRSAPAAEAYIQITGDWRGPYGRNYSSLAELDIREAIAFVRRHFKVDPRRVYLFGHSIGGFGSWRLGSFYPGRFAAVAPYAGRPQGYPIENMAALPVRVYHGGADRGVPPVWERYGVRKLKAAGGRASMRTYPGAGHWAYGAVGDAVRWLLAQKPEPPPKTVRFATRWVSRGRGRAHWVEVLELENPHRAARLKLTAEDGALRGRVENVSALRVDSLKQLFAGRRDLLLALNGREVKIARRSRASLSLRFNADGSFRLTDEKKAVPIEPVYSEGSIQNLFDGKPVRIVVPSGGTEQYRKAVAAEARRMARWDGRYGGIPVLKDSEVDALKPRAHLILLGSPESNGCLRKLLDLLPVRQSGERLSVPGLGEYQTKGRGYAFYYHHPKQPGYRIMMFVSSDAAFFKKVPAVLPDGLYSWRASMGAAPDFVLYDCGTGRYLRVASLGKDWKFGREYSESPRLRKELGTSVGLHRCLGEALRRACGADYSYTLSAPGLRLDPDSMRTADLVCLARALWFTGLCDSTVIDFDAKSFAFLAGRLYNKEKFGRAYEPFGLWPRPARDWSAPAGATRTVCLIENWFEQFDHAARSGWMRGGYGLGGVRTVKADVLAEMARLAARKKK